MTKFPRVIAALVALAGFQIAQAVSFDYSAPITFGGDFSTFSFSGDSEIRTGALMGLEVQITGTYTIGGPLGFGVSSAPVTGSGLFRINDGAGHWFEATLEWNNIELFMGSTYGRLNFNGLVNMTDFSYAGANATLLDLRNHGSAVNNGLFVLPATFSGGYPPSGADLWGTVASRQVPDGGTTAALIGLGVVGLGVFARRRKA
jgi:hypothetical protein